MDEKEQIRNSTSLLLCFLVSIILFLLGTLPFHYVNYNDENHIFLKESFTFKNTIVNQRDIRLLIERHNNASFFEQANIRQESLHKVLVENGIIISTKPSNENDF